MIRFTLFCLVLFHATESSAQTFQAEVSAGLNFSQLDGDQLSGFNKIGLRSGIWFGSPASKPIFGRIGFLFDQKGSSTSIQIGTAQSSESIQLNYISMPLIIGLREWKYEPLLEIYKIEISAGVNLSYLIKASSTNQFYNSTADFSSFDLAPTLGFSYRLGTKTKFQFFYERSVLKIFKTPNTTIRGLQSYLVNFGIHYEWNK